MTILLLFVAALLEAGGDALIRSGLHSSTIIARTSFFLVGAIVLFSYGYVVNAPPWDFGPLLGVHVVFFFINFCWEARSYLLVGSSFHSTPEANARKRGGVTNLGDLSKIGDNGSGMGLRSKLILSALALFVAAASAVAQEETLIVAGTKLS